MLAFERQSQNTAPGSGRLITRRLKPQLVDRLQQQPQSNNTNNAPVQSNVNNTQTQQQSNLHSTPVPTSRGLQPRPQSSTTDDLDTPQSESDWLRMLQDSNNTTNNNTIAPPLPKGLVDPALYSPKQFSPRRLNNGTRRAADINGTVTSDTTGLGLNAPTLGLGKSSRTSANAPQWDLSKFHSPVVSQRRLSSKAVTNSNAQPSPKLGLGRIIQPNPNSDELSTMLAKQAITDN